MNPQPAGRVYLIGAGPGDPGLLTRRGEALLRQADVVVYDYLTNAALLELAPPEAERIYVGRPAGASKRPSQEEIYRLLIEQARRGRVVVRLKGGDPFVFGRGGEEALALLEAGIPFEVIPGVSAALAAPAMAGIPVTHRGLTSTLHIVAAHDDPASAQCSVDWDWLGKCRGTLVVLMGVARLPAILERLQAAGMDGSTPLALIHWGSYPRQRTIRDTVAGLRARLKSLIPGTPSTLVIGAVAALDEGLNWFERRPLFGRRIALTRPQAESDAFAPALEAAGAEVWLTPVLDFEPLPPPEPVAAALDDLRRKGGWLILPSPTALRYFFDALETSGLDARSLLGIRVAVVGDGSARALKERGVRADFVPDQARGEALAQTLPREEGRRRVLVAGSRLARPELIEGLRQRGFDLTHWALYQPRPNAGEIDRLLGALAAGRLTDVVVFSPSAVQAIVERVPAIALPEPRAGVGAESLGSGGARWFAIGPTTARALEEAGFPVAGAAASPTPAALVELISRANPGGPAGRRSRAAGGGRARSSAEAGR